MKEALVAVIIALVAGSILNNMGVLSFTRPDIQQSEKELATSLPQLKDSNFKAEVLNSNMPVLVDFWAPWCGPCRRLSPVIEQLAKDYNGRVKIVKMNIDDNQETADTYKIQAIPNLCLFKDGKLIDQIQGAAPKADIATTIDHDFGFLPN